MFKWYSHCPIARCYIRVASRSLLTALLSVLFFPPGFARPPINAATCPSAGGRPRVPVTRHKNQRHMKNHYDQHPLGLMGTEDFIEMQTKIKEHAEASC
ncbi:hypothetical protein Q7C36_021948 [Tachysurus vachellii]|uniref:Secreted protein n=1 Tax=Tachysurus vachellii TaxID=175792 RepID=A0AA88IJW7_TACVA|nr:hypothetical protein Q7C36_021948 [Tachysurus vachellii]